MTDGNPGAILLLAPVLLLLAQDPVLLRFLDKRRRYVPPVAAVTAYLAGERAALVHCLMHCWAFFHYPSCPGWLAAVLAPHACHLTILPPSPTLHTHKPSSPAATSVYQLYADAADIPAGKFDASTATYIFKQLGCLAACLPAPLLLLGWLWSKAPPPAAVVLASAPPALLAYWACELDELRIAAGVALAATVALLLGAQQSQKASRAFI